MLITQHLLLPTLPGKPVDTINGLCKRAAYPGMHNVVTQSKPGFTWHFSMQGLPSRSVATPERRLLPYIFTLTFLLKKRRLFSVALSVSWLVVFAIKQEPGCSPVHSLYAVRTFLTNTLAR